MKKPIRFVAGLALALAVTVTVSLAARENPLLTKSPLPFQAPPFDKIQVSDYQPAIEEGMKQQLAEIAAIAENPEPPTFANTIEAMERSGELFTRAYKVFYNVEQSDTNEALQKIKAELAPKISAHNDAIYMNPKLYARVQAIYDKRDALGLDAEAKYLVERDRLLFVRSGANLGAADKARLTKLNDRARRPVDAVRREAPRRHERGRRRRGPESRPRRPLGRATSPRPPAPRRKRSWTGSGSCACRTRRNSRRSPRSRTARSASASSRRSMARGDHGGPNDTRAARREAGGSAGRKGEAPRVRHVGGLRARRPDGEDAGERGAAA